VSLTINEIFSTMFSYYHQKLILIIEVLFLKAGIKKHLINY